MGVDSEGGSCEGDEDELKNDDDDDNEDEEWVFGDVF